MGQCYTDMVLGPKLSFFLAAETGNLTKVKKMVASGKVGVKETKDDDGWTALICCSPRGHVEVARFLLSQGADVNHRAKDGLTAIMYSSRNGKVEFVRLMIEQGADVNAVRSDGDKRQTALSLAVENNELETVQLLLQNGADVTKGQCYSFKSWEKKTIKEYLEENPEKHPDIFKLFNGESPVETGVPAPALAPYQGQTR